MSKKRNLGVKKSDDFLPKNRNIFSGNLEDSEILESIHPEVNVC
jgi:hypothetical protein